MNDIEFVAEENPGEVILKPKEINLKTFFQYMRWKGITIFPYLSKKEKFPFIQIKNK